ncbi:hypothetical protein An12g04080 [Aspergillus niger]|uniref:Uncharacterized protein n=2 Tax=Aspergillus niger TaxID=5061 RepID=A2QZ93_ASPNC|nr:hypothetical protein An12g04080 [Aspergillus niger]CAK46178.1 hypothetical protein An12g04080 [Aspergillus niger]
MLRVACMSSTSKEDAQTTMRLSRTPSHSGLLPGAGAGNISLGTLESAGRATSG